MASEICHRRAGVAWDDVPMGGVDEWQVKCAVSGIKDEPLGIGAGRVSCIVELAEFNEIHCTRSFLFVWAASRSHTWSKGLRMMVDQLLA